MLPTPPLSHALVVDDWLTHCMSWVIVNLRPFTVWVHTVWPGTTDVVKRAGSAAGPRTFSMADDASWAAITRWRVSPETRVPDSNRRAAATNATRRSVDATTTSTIVNPASASNPSPRKLREARTRRARAGRCMQEKSASGPQF